MRILRPSNHRGINALFVTQGCPSNSVSYSLKTSTNSHALFIPRRGPIMHGPPAVCVNAVKMLCTFQSCEPGAEQVSRKSV